MLLEMAGVISVILLIWAVCAPVLGMNNESVEPSDMKLFTKMNNVSINKTLLPVQFNIDCDFTVTNLKTSSTSTSIELNWETTSIKCQDVLDKLMELYYHCSCKLRDEYYKPENKENIPFNGRRCTIIGLKPYKDYVCDVHAIYNKTRKFTRTTNKVKTAPGEPVLNGNLQVQNPVNNAIKVSCRDKTIELNGPKEEYIAKLHDFPHKKLKSPNCDFEFKDLSYLTSYSVEVFLSNGHSKSKPLTTSAATLYNDKALIGFLVFLIIITSVALLLVLYKIYVLKHRKSHDNEEQKLFSTVIYANMPPPKRQPMKI